MHSVYALLLVAALVVLAGLHLFRPSKLPLWLRMGFSGGLAYLLVGILLGPAGLGLIGRDSLALLDPVLNLAIGWVGLVLGLQLKLRDVRRIPAADWSGSLLQFLLCSLVLGGVFYVFFRLAGLEDAAPAAASLGLAAGATSPTLIGLLVQDAGLRRSAWLRRALMYSNLDGIYAVVLLGAAWALAHPNPRLAAQLPAVLQLILPLSLGILLGWIFHFFLARGMEASRMVVLVVGVLIFCGGVAAVMRISPLFLNLVVGVWLINQSSHANHLYRFLVIYEQPLFLGLILAAGLLWEPVGWMLAPALLCYVAFRAAGKFFGWRLCDRIWPLPGETDIVSRGETAEETRPARSPGWILLPQGGVALAIALSHLQLLGGPGGRWVLGITVPGVLVFAILSAVVAEGRAKC